MKNVVNEVELPGLEVVVRNGSGEIAVCGMFKSDERTWDVVVGIVDHTERDGVAAALQLALTAVQGATFVANGMVGVPRESPDAPFQE